MNAYKNTLRLLSIGIFGVAAVHVLLGVSAEPLLGAVVSQTSLSDPSLDSQNRFYGAAFSLFGVLWWLSSSDIGRYQTFLVGSFLVFFLAGLSRLASIAFLGLPSIPILGLTAIELLLPLVMYLWLKRVVS